MIIDNVELKCSLTHQEWMSIPDVPETFVLIGVLVKPNPRMKSATYMVETYGIVALADKRTLAPGDKFISGHIVLTFSTFEGMAKFILSL